MGKNYTPGHASALFSDWLKPYMQEYERKREDREYKAPLGERNMGILNVALGSATFIKKMNDTMEANKLATGKYQVKEGDFFDETSLADLPLSMQPQAIFEKGKTALFGPGVEPIPETMKQGGKVRKYQEGDIINPLEFRKPESIIDQLTPVKTPEIKEVTKAEALGMKLDPMAEKGKQVYGEAASALGSVQTLDKSKSGLDKAVAIYDLAEQGERGVRAGIKGAKMIAEKLAKKKVTEELTKKVAKEGVKKVAEVGTKKIAEEGAKSTLGKLAPGVSIATGAKKFAEADTTAGKISGGLEVIGGFAKTFAPGVGTIVGTGLDVLSTGIDMFTGTKPGKRRHIARW